MAHYTISTCVEIFHYPELKKKTNKIIKLKNKSAEMLHEDS
jgi:hypothetical protein